MVKYHYHTLVRHSNGQIASISEHILEDMLPVSTGLLLSNLVKLAYKEEPIEAIADAAVYVYSKEAHHDDGPVWEEKKLLENIQENIEYGILLPKNDHVEDESKTPGPNKRKKDENSNSPGIDLDLPNALKNPIESATQVYSDILSSMTTGKALLKKPALGSFTSIELPHTGTDIDMRFGFGFSEGQESAWGVTTMGEKLTKLLVDESTYDILLIGKSGCGKTRAIFDAGMKKYCLLFTVSSFDSKLGAARRDPGGFDHSFAGLVRDIRNILTDSSLSDDRKKRLCDHHILALIVARTLTMFYFSKQDQSSPAAWLVYQLTRQVHELSSPIYLSLARRNDHFLISLRENLLRKLDFFFAFDEAQFGYELFKKDQSLWKRSTGAAVGLASPFLRMLSGPKPIVIAGTALRLDSVYACLSDLGKRGSYKTLNDFPPVSLTEIKTKLSAVLNLSDVKLGEVKDLWKLEGRGRLIGGLLGTLADVVEEGETQEKKVLLEKAIKRHYLSMLNALKKRIESRLCGGVNPSPLRQNPPTPFPECLESLAISCLLGGTITKLVKDFDIDLLHVGLCSLRKIDDKDNYVLDEELGKQAILDLAVDKERFAMSFSKIAQLCRPAGGNAMEPLLVAELRAWSIENRGGTVKSFLSELFDILPDNLPAWIEQSKFCVAGGFNKENCIARGIDNDIDFVKKAFEDETLRNRLHSPSTVKRPDFEAVMEGHQGKVWFLSVSSKLYSTPYDDEAESDLRSTMPDMFYKQKDGTKNKQCSRLRESWERLLADKKDCFKRNLRIHLCLPEVKRSDSNPERVFRKGNSIVAYVTAANVNKIFRASTVSILDEIGCL